ncbi:MAG: sn-glycerol-1-phosphate dehydrogenase [Bacillota bacterium]|nr:sn-glycerol-1-phosphate dehydrogenase [Bacillota bacterium]
MNDKYSELNNPEKWYDMADMKTLRGWFGQTRKCPACGRMHGLHTRMMEQTPDMALHIGQYLAVLGLKGRCLVVMDENTKAAAGDALMEGLGAYRPTSIVYTRPDLHADEQALGSLLTAISGRPDFLVSCGSGTLTDITRYNSFMTGIPFVAYATAASVDGFASGSAPLLVKGFKATYPAAAPEGIFYDPLVLARAPQQMTAAGFGDVLAKVLAILDWRLAYAAEDEDYCPLIAALVDRAVQDCLNLADDLAIRTGDSTANDAAAKPEPVQDKAQDKAIKSKGEACSRLMETLALTGMAMQMMGNTRPASGAEHHISHLLEMRDIQKHHQGSLHGDKVGIGTLIGMYMYLRLFEGGKMPEQRPTMDPVTWEAEVRRVYGPLAEHALAINPSEPPRGKEWDEQKKQLEIAMNAYGFATVDRFKTLLPVARDKILAMGGPVRPEQLGYSVQDAYDAIAFGKEVRPKFTTLRLAERYGWIYDLAEEISQGLPKGTLY